MKALLRLYVEYLLTAAAGMFLIMVMIIVASDSIVGKILTIILFIALGLWVLYFLSPDPSDPVVAPFPPSPLPPSRPPASTSPPSEIEEPDNPKLSGSQSMPLELQEIPERLQLKPAPEDPVAVDHLLLQNANEHQETAPKGEEKNESDKPKN